jgi:uroporphyrinogen decarboxylase
MKTMKPKERVQAALHHCEPDRVPLALWGSYYTLNDDTYFQVLRHLGLGEPMQPFRKSKPRNSNYYDDRVLDRLDTDVRYVWSGFTDLGGARMDRDCRDAWNVVWRRSGPHITSVGAPMAGLSIEEIGAHPWPDPELYLDIPLMQERLKFLQREYPDHAIGARAVNSYGPFEQAAALRGRESFYMDLIAEPELSRRIIEGCTDVIVRAQSLYLEVVGKKLDFFEIPGDDYGATEDLMISPAIFDDLFKPAIKRIVASVKEFDPDLPVVFHSDGAITKIIPGLVEAGVGVLNPMEPLPAMDWTAVKREYAQRLCFMGGVDLKRALTGSVEDVAEDIKRCLRTFAVGGGYILTSSNHIPPDVPPQNVEALFRLGRELGQYPLSL